MKTTYVITGSRDGFYEDVSLICDDVVDQFEEVLNDIREEGGS